jgi:hypothetical protein
MTGCEKKMLNKTGKQMGVGKKFRAEPAVGKSEENVSNIPERQIFGTGS